MPVQYYDTVSIHGPVTIEGNLTGIDASVSVTGNVAGITAPVSVSGNIAGITAPVEVVGNLTAVLTGNVDGITAPVAISGNVAGITANVSALVLGNVAGITAPVGVSGNIEGITANVSAVVLGNVAGITATVTVAGNSYGGVVFTNDRGHDDAFGRLRVSNPIQLLQAKRIGNTSDLTMTNSVSGSGAAVYDANLAATRLTVGTAVGTAVRQTKARGVYQPGKSMLSLQTFVMAPARSNLTQQVGYFDTQNGIFLRVSNNATSIVRRSFATGAVTEEVVPQSSWNVDKMDGTGISGINANLQLSQILAMDFEWLGVGRVRTGFVVNGQLYVAHQFLNTNNLSSVYMSNPNLPVRWENYATGDIAGVANLDAICCALSSEGGYDISGIDMNVDSGNVGIAFAANQIKEVLAVRMRPEFTSYATAYLQGVMLASTGGAVPFFWKVLLNPTAANVGTWTTVNTNSVLEYNINRAITPNTGTPIVGGVTNAAFATSTMLNERTVYSLGTDLAGTTDVLSLQMNSKAPTAQTVYVNMFMRELY